MISFSDVTEKTTLSNVSFTFDKGILGVLSASEKEKAVFASLASGNLTADEGSVTGNVKTAFVAKKAPLPDTLTVKEYFEFVRNITGKKEFTEQAESLSGEFGEKLIFSLDDAKRQIIAITAAMLGEPEILVTDDPGCSLEDEGKNEVFDVLIGISEKIPVIMTSSSVSDCQGLCSHLLALGKGKALAFGETETVVSTVSAPYSLTLRVKGTEEKIAMIENSLGVSAHPTEKANTFELTVSGISTDDPEALVNIKKKVRASGAALLTFKPENEELRALFGYLSSRETELKAKAEEERPQELTKVTGSLLKFSHEEDEDGFSSDNEEEENKEAESVGDGESTLFSSKE